MELSLKHSLYVNFLEIGTKITAPSVVTCTVFPYIDIIKDHESSLVPGFFSGRSEKQLISYLFLKQNLEFNITYVRNICRI